MNSSNSNTLRLQQVQPLLPSWNSACPGWCTHSSSSRGDEGSYVLLQLLRLQVAPVGIIADGSSDSSSGAGAGDRVGVGAAAWARDSREGGDSPMLFSIVATGFRVGMSCRDSAVGAGIDSGCGVSSTVECFPVVQGLMARNSSNVRTLGLQHFQPRKCESVRRLSPDLVDNHLSALRETPADRGDKHMAHQDQ